MRKLHIGVAIAAVAFGGLLVSAQAPQAPAAPAPQEQGVGPAPGARAGAAAPLESQVVAGKVAGVGEAAVDNSARCCSRGPTRATARRSTRSPRTRWPSSNGSATTRGSGTRSSARTRTSSTTTALKTDGTNASGGPSLSNVDGIFFLGHRESALNDQQKKELLAFVRERQRLRRGAHRPDGASSRGRVRRDARREVRRAPLHGPGQVINEQPANPIVKHWGAAFNYSDEFYRPKGLSRDKVDVLLRFNPASAPASKLPADGDFPLVWTKNYGKGRVFYSSFSHGTEAWDIRNLQLMIFEAIRWSLGLTDAPVMPHPMSAAPADRPRRAAAQ